MPHINHISNIFNLSLKSFFLEKIIQNPPTFLRYRYLSVTVHQHVSDLSLSISVSSDLHHLLAGGLATEIPQLAKVVVEGMLPGDLHAVFFGSANRCPEKRLFFGMGKCERWWRFFGKIWWR